MKKLLFGIALMGMSFPVLADNMVLMIGDGMGFNHLACTESAEAPLFMKTLPMQGAVHTASADHETTDSAAGATAYACGQKTNNGFVGKLPDESDCETIAETARKQGYFVGIISDDMLTGATPSSFYAHVTDRRDANGIQSQLDKASKKMNIKVGVEDIYTETEQMLKAAQKSGKPFFLMIESAHIDVESHKNQLKEMKNRLKQFDNTIKLVSDYIDKNKNTNMIVLADHETGGLTQECVYTSYKHSSADIPYFAKGRKISLEGDVENTDIYPVMQRVLFKGK